MERAQHHVTFIRDSDRTRVVFVFDALDYSESAARRKAFALAPLGFRHAAYRLHDGGPLRIPADGDDYGNEMPFPQPRAA